MPTRDIKTKRKSGETMQSFEASSGKPPVYDIIGRRLREYYDDVAKQPVPDRFAELLRKLDAKPPVKPKS
jgi:Anti-sigma factor NepR